MENRYAPVLDVVRCFAALMVAMFHFCSTWPHGVRSPLDELGYPFSLGDDRFFYFGFVGVEIFFVISGFVIATSCVGRSPRDFLIGRAMRLLPILWLSVIIGSAILLAFGAAPGAIASRAIMSAVLWPTGPYLDVVAWTLVVEVIFYVTVWTLLIVAGDQIEKHLLSLAGVLAIASLANQIVELFGFKLGDLIPTLLLLRHGAFFALGIFIWSFSKRVRPATLPVLVAVSSCLLEIHAAVAGRNADAAVQYSALLPMLVWACSVAAILYGAMNLRQTASRPVRFAGLLTYPVYLLHQTVGGAVITIAYRSGLPFGICLIAGIFAVLLVAAAIIEVVEPRIRPIFRWCLEKAVPFRRQLSPA